MYVCVLTISILYSFQICCCINGSDYIFFTSAILRHLFQRIHTGLLTELKHSPVSSPSCLYFITSIFTHYSTFWFTSVYNNCIFCVCIYVCVLIILTFLTKGWLFSHTVAKWFFMGELFLAKKWLYYLVSKINFFLTMPLHSFLF